METILNLDLTTLQIAMITYTLVWGCLYGVSNTFVRLSALFGEGTFRQDSLGKVADNTWYICIVLLLIDLV